MSDKPSSSKQRRSSQSSPGPSTSSVATSTPVTTASAQPAPSPEQLIYLNQRLSGMPQAKTLAVWQLQAVLFHAKLTQYYQQFVDLGADDIDQLMQCEETEFLEIMRLITMATKPLHVRRFQRTLSEFSRDRVTFLRNAAIQIGPPPVMDLPTSSQTTSLQAALQFLVPGYNPATEVQPSRTSIPPPTSSLGLVSTETPNMPRLFPQPPTIYPMAVTTSSITTAAPSSSKPFITTIIPYPSASDLLSLVSQSSIPRLQIPTTSPSTAAGPGPSSSRTVSPIAGPSGCGSNQSIPSPGSDTDYIPQEGFEGGVLPEGDIPQIVKLAEKLYSERPELHTLKPKFVQNKKKLPKDLVAAMDMSPEDRTRPTVFRRYSAIYGRFDAKRMKDKPLSYHELLVNEAAAQLCLIQPVLLTRRDELFPLARQVVRESNFPGFRAMSRGERKRPFDSKSERSASPHSIRSNPSESPEPSSHEKRSTSSKPDPGPSSSGESSHKRSKSER